MANRVLSGSLFIPSHTLVAAALLGLTLLGANYKLTLGMAAAKWDADMFFAPYQMLVADHARAGKFVLWDPWLNGGSPDYAEPQIGSFSPVAIVLGLLTGGTELAFRVYWLVIWFLGGLGVVLLGRHLRAPPWGCYVVALGFVFSGFYTGHAEHTSTLYTISSLAFLIWRLDVALSSRILRPAVEAGVIWGLSGLGGYPAWVFLNACFAGLWAIGRLWFPEPRQDDDSGESPRMPVVVPRLTIWFAALALTILGSVGLVVLSPTYAAFFGETPGYTERSEPLSRETAVTSNALHPGALATFASPYLSLLKLHNLELWEYTDLSTASVYLGPIVPVLALLALVAGAKDRWRWWIAGVAVVFLLAALGNSFPLRGWLYDLVSPTRYFRHPGFFRIYPMFALVVLALLATRDLSAGSRGSHWRVRPVFAGMAAFVSAAAIFAYYSVMRVVENPGRHSGNAELHLWITWLGISGVALVLTKAPSATRTWLPRALLITLAGADAFFVAHIAQPTMYESGRVREIWNRIADEHNPSFDLSSRGLQREQLAPHWLTAEGVPHNKNLALKIPTFQNYAAITNRFHLDLVQRPVLSAMATGSNRIWFSSQVVVTPPTDQAYSAFVQRSETLGQGVLVVHQGGGHVIRPESLMSSEDAAIAGIHRLPAATSVIVKVKTYRPNELRFEATAPAKGWLLVTDRWSRGWRATVNGTPTDVFAANFIFRALAVEAGPNDVHFTYIPVGFPLLVILSWSMVFLTLAFAIYSAVRRFATVP